MRLPISVILFFWVAMHSKGVADEESGERQRISYWRQYVAEAGDLDARPLAQRFETLGNVLRGIGTPEHYRYAGPEAAAFQTEVQAALLETPGHAKYFGDEIEREREAARSIPRTAQTKYDSVRSKCLMGILPHLPSPETVQVLGHYLDDERDIPLHEVGESMERDFVAEPENAWLAVGALSMIGLRDSPYPPLPTVSTAKRIPEQAVALPKFRAWYAEVKEGKCSFSFAGQRVEYRFKPDGTWQTTPLAISDEVIREEQKLPNPIPSTAPPASSEKAVPVSSSSPNAWLWLTGGAAALVAAGAWFAWRRSKPA